MWISCAELFDASVAVLSKSTRRQSAAFVFSLISFKPRLIWKPANCHFLLLLRITFDDYACRSIMPSKNRWLLSKISFGSILTDTKASFLLSATTWMHLTIRKRRLPWYGSSAKILTALIMVNIWFFVCLRRGITIVSIFFGSPRASWSFYWLVRWWRAGCSIATTDGSRQAFP